MAVSKLDVLRYVASYPDLMALYGADWELAASNISSFESRPVTFDPWAYLASASNYDVLAAFGADPEAAAKHFIEYGIREGRTVTFDAWGYLASAANSDVLAAFGADPVAAAKHYVEYGIREGRTVTFDAWGYLASAANSDVLAAFGVDTQAAAKHYVEYGIREGRTVTFDAWGYLASAANSDVLAAFGADPEAAAKHYVEYGIREGRLVNGFTQSVFASNIAQAYASQIQGEGFDTANASDVAHFYVLQNTDSSNDAAIIRGDVRASLTESNVAQTARGQLTVVDVDSANNFVAASSVRGANGYGTFNIGSDGAWTYVMGSAQDSFVGGQVYTDSTTVRAADGTTQV